MNTVQSVSILEPSRVKTSRKRRSSVPLTSFISYFGVFLMIISLVAISYQPPVNEGAVASVNTGPTNNSTAASTEATVDQLMATNIAATIAEAADLPVTNNVANLSQSLAVESTLSQTDTNVISKPQIVNASEDSRSTRSYTTVAGDTVQIVAQRYGISVTTIKWANSLTSDALEAGRVLTIPPVDGIVYTVKEGDTTESILNKYKADRDRFLTLNDLDLSGNPVAGSRVIIPDGNLPENERPGYVAPRPAATSTYNGIRTYSGGYGSSWTGGVSGGNRYAWGNCTWYVYERRMQLGRPIGGLWGNANTWAYSAAANGFAVTGEPTAGSIMQNGGGYGHVAVVESVNPGVSITISEMNGYRFGGGFARVGTGEIPWADAMSGYYRYIQ